MSNVIASDWKTHSQNSLLIGGAALHGTTTKLRWVLAKIVKSGLSWHRLDSLVSLGTIWIHLKFWNVPKSKPYSFFILILFFGIV